MTQRKVHDVELLYLTVSFAKGEGLNAKGQVQTFDYKQTTPQEERLGPLPLYSHIHPAYLGHYLKRCAAATPRSISASL